MREIFDMRATLLVGGVVVVLVGVRGPGTTPPVRLVTVTIPGGGNPW
jgi:hypothetical protein